MGGWGCRVGEVGGLDLGISEFLIYLFIIYLFIDSYKVKGREQ